jgi:tape measure domain-containing protein
MINLTVVIDNEEAVRKFRELQQTARTVTSNVVNDADRMDIAMHKLGNTLAQIGVGISLAGLVRQLAMTRGEFQQLEVAFTTLLQSKEKADALMAEMVELAAKTPFDLQGVADGARQLLAYGFAAEDITDTLTRLGNVAAGLGLPLERLTYLYGTTAVQGRLYARDMLQFTSSGIPVLQEMAKMYGKTTDEINAMVTAGKIGFEDVKKVIEGMTNEGGQFYNLMQEQSKTISGLISNLSDAIDTMFNNMGKSSEGIIAGVLKGTISLVENYQKVLDILIPLVAAYGAYKAALIAVAAAQKVQTIVEATKAILEQTKMLTRATQAQILFNKAVKANPYVLAASALIGIVTALTTFSKKAKSTTDIVSDLNAVTSDYASNADSISDLADTYEVLASKTSRTKTENDQLADTMNKLASAVPSAISQFDEYGRVLGINITKIRAFSDAQKEALKIDVTSQISTAKTRVSDIDRELAGLSSIYQDKYYYRNKTTTVGGQLVVLQDLEKVPYSEKQIEDAARKANELYAERQQLIDAITNGEKTLAGITSGGQQSSAAAGSIVSATENLKSAQKAYDEAVKAWKSAISSGENVETVKEKQSAVENAKKTLDEAKKLAGVDDKTTTSVTKAQEKLSDLILANDRELQQSRIDIMKDGKQKELAEIDLRTKEELDKLKEDKSKLEAAQGGSLTANQTKDFQERESNIRQIDADDRAAVDLKYAQELDRIYKQITDDTLSEEDRRINSIKEKYEEFRKWVDNALKAGNISQEQATDLGIRIDRAEIAASLNAVVEEYRSAEDRIAKIRQNAENARNAATAGGREDLIPQINKSEAQQVGEIRAEELMKTDDWINLFQNLDALSSREILRIIDNINSLLKDADLDPINLKTVTDKLDEAAETATRKNPFASISANFKAYKQALANKDDIRAVELRKQAWLGVSEALNIVSSTISGISSIASTFGADEDTTASINEIAGAVGGTAQAVAGFASGNPVQGIQGVVSVISNLWSLLSGDRRKERTIEALQDQVDALAKSYDALGDAINKAYSTDASNLIGQQNDMLKQQNVLLQKQIREEQSKKKSDDDRIKEWQDQIEENNKLIQENIDKAQDAIFGEDVQSAIDNFAEAYANAWAQGEDRAKSAKDFVKDMIKQMVIEAMKADISSPMQAIRDKLQQFWSDGVISPTEEGIINQMVDDITNELNNQYGWADKYLQDTETESSQSGTSRGFSTMSQDTASELNGRFTDIQGKINILVEQAAYGRSISIEQLNRMTDTRDILVQMNGNVADIRTFTKVLPEMRDSLAAMNRKLDNL